jgi:hypothetical protein
MAIENSKRLKAAGPIDPENGFPLWFEDDTGLRLELGLNRDPLNPDLLLPVIGDLQTPGDPLVFPTNFPEESFYFSAEAELTVRGDNGVPARARVILALEAAFGGDGDPQEGANVVFARIRVRMDDLIPGQTYTVTHPYGVTNPLEADDRGRVFYTEDLGIVEGNPAAVVRSGQVAPFLRGTSVEPPGYIGDGATPQRVTGSPLNTNFVMIEGNNVRLGAANPNDPDPTNPDKAWTDQFTVQGKIAQRVGAWVDGTTYTKAADGSTLLNIQARSIANQDLRLVATGVHIQLMGEGDFYTGLAQVSTLPTDARLVNITDSPPTSFPVAFTDLVRVESAVHDRIAETLTIRATSSDPNAILKLPQLGLTLTSNPELLLRRAAPAEIIVESNMGGVGRQFVQVTGAADANQPVKAIIVPVLAAFAGEAVTLDGSASLGATSFAWAQVNGLTVTLNGANAVKPTFTPPAAGTYTFTLTAQGNGAPNVASVTINVKPALGPDRITAQCEYRTSKQQFRITGTVNQIPNQMVITFRGVELGQAAADISGDWSIKEALPQALLNVPPAPGEVVQIRSRRSGGDIPFTLRIRN